MKLKQIHATQREQESAAQRYRNYLQQYAAQLGDHPERYEVEIAEAERLVDRLRRIYGRNDCNPAFPITSYSFNQQTYEN